MSDNLNSVYVCKECEIEKQAMKRQIDALKNLLKSKGIMLDEEEKELPNIWPILNNENSYSDYPENFKAMQEAEDEYNYYQDDLNFDAARERRMK